MYILYKNISCCRATFLATITVGLNTFAVLGHSCTRTWGLLWLLLQMIRGQAKRARVQAENKVTKFHHASLQNYFPRHKEDTTLFIQLPPYFTFLYCHPCKQHIPFFHIHQLPQHLIFAESASSSYLPSLPLSASQIDWILLLCPTSLLYHFQLHNYILHITISIDFYIWYIRKCEPSKIKGIKVPKDCTTPFILSILWR